MTKEENGRQTVYAKTRKQWRTWLQKHHSKEKSIWLIIYRRKSGTPSVYYEEAVEEALCFGWIDSLGNKRDEVSYYQFFAQRKPKSNWSSLNRQRAEKMIEEGLMTEAGQKMIDLAKEKGTWTALEDVQKAVIPKDLQKEFDTNKTAYRYFEAFPLSAKRGILEWILNAKKPETREKRIAETVRLAAQNSKANQYRK